MANRKKIIVLIVVSLFILGFCYKNPKITNNDRISEMKLSTDTGFQSPSTSSNEALVGSDESWSSVDLSKSQSDSYAEVSLGKGAYSDYLRVVDFGFSIPEATIDGIEVEIDKYASNSLIQDYDVYLVLSGSTQGDDYAKTGVGWAISDTDIYLSYGGASDTWNSGLTYSNINDATFGVEFSAINTKTGAPATYTAYIDHIRIKIYYTITEEDNDPPTWDTLTESADPLELGNTETININVYDASTISNVYIEIDAVNNSMSFISGDNYRYSTWTPTSVGEKIYQIHMIDEYNNINQTNDLTITVQDTTDPIIDNVIESADPLELGNIETIDCDITDESNMEFVYLEFEGSNHSMIFISGINWRYSTWQPSETGNFPYKIWANDTEGNIVSYDGDITVQETDITPPTWDTLTESADPLELGNTETININVYDASTIDNVYIEIDAVNNSMSFISGDNYRYSTWTPTSVGEKIYQIHMIDEYNNINQTDDLTITVEDTTDPIIDNVIESADPLELGNIETIDCDITDESNMEFVYLEFEGSNHSMSFVSGVKWEYTSWTPTSVGNYPYKIWANDTEGNIHFVSGSIIVEDTINPVIDNVIESADPLTLGNIETIECDITDESDMYFVYLEFDGSNHSMSLKSGITWEYTTWQPISIGIKNYKIWANDTEGNIHFVSGSITVQEAGADSDAPTWDNLKELYFVLELGINQTISINVYDDSTISNVYIEINGVNYTMSNVSEVYSYSNWLPLTEGNYVYKIYMIDEYGYTSEVSGSFPVQNSPDLLLSVFVLSFLMALMLFLYLKIRKFELILIVFLFSLVIGGYSLNRLMLPFFPYLQLFFLLFQTIIFYLTSEYEYKKRKGAKYR